MVGEDTAKTWVYITPNGNYTASHWNNKSLGDMSALYSYSKLPKETIYSHQKQLRCYTIIQPSHYVQSLMLVEKKIKK